MGIIFGVTKPIGQLIEERDLLDLALCTEKFAPDGTFVYTQGHVGMGFQPYRTHQRSRHEVLPLADANGNVLSFDGRLDNHVELCHSLDIRGMDVPDSRIILKAFESWGADSFSQLVGEWALALWVNSEQALYLARDHAGSRSLYFECLGRRILWSTYLETFFAGGRTAALDQDFAALYLACQSTHELTPYKNIKAVPPSYYLRFHDGSIAPTEHWQSIARDSIVYATDVQYEEHFLELFKQSVRRRTGPGAPILAELSGGMDSTSIVCVSDHLRGSDNPTTGLLETVSYYDNSEPTWNEFPYFTAVEKSRGKSGIHLDRSYSERSIGIEHSINSHQLWPGAYGSSSTFETQLYDATKEYDFRTVVSGLGGDEVLGGIPNPLPELADLMFGGRLPSLFKSSVEWCLADRVPLLHMLAKTSGFVCEVYFPRLSNPKAAPPWIRRIPQPQKAADPAPEYFLKRLRCGPPSRLDNRATWCSALETLPNRVLSSQQRFEYRYPFLDRDLVEYLFRIPRRQLVEPGRRRSLMRRALKNIVPDLILERRRKAYLIRGPLNLIRRERDWLATLFRNLGSAELGLVDVTQLPAALDLIAINGNPEWWPHLMRLISFECWLSSAPLSDSPQKLHYVANDIRVRLSSKGDLINRKFDPTWRTR